MRIVLMIVLFVAIAAAVSAQDFNKGLAAAQNGDYATALKEWTPLAEQGDGFAQLNLGVMYDLGEGVPKDHQEANKWYKLAAEQDIAQAQYNLGYAYNKGQGVPQDHQEANEWYRLAAEQGHTSAQTNLGYMYGQGLGVLQDNVLAHMWYNLSAANGSDLGGENRDIIAERMTSEDISKAQAMARKCMNSDY